MERYISPPIQGPGTGLGTSSSAPPMIFFDDFLGGINVAPPGAGTGVGNVAAVWEIAVRDGGTVGLNNDHQCYG